MSRLDELIKKLCPDGVEYKRLDRLCKIYDGTHSTPKYTDSGVKFVSVENIKDLYGTTKYISEEAYNKYKIKPQLNDVLMTRIGSIGVCTVIEKEEPLAYYVSLALLRPEASVYNSKFLKYAIESIVGRKELRKWTLVNAVPIKINKDDIGKIKLPVPPLEIQEEIVRILDKFTDCVAELQIELQAELQARRQQYEYYNKFLCNFDKHDIFKLGDVATIKTGKKPESIEETPAEFEYINAGTSNSGYTNNYNCQGDTVTTPSRGQGGIGFVGYQLNPFWLGPLCYQIRSKDDSIVLNKYLYYYLKCFSEKILGCKKEGGTPAINASDLATITVEIPTIENQKRIIAILNKFEKICDNLSEGLLAEIEASQKQYEYYRDKLLTFKELS